MSTITSKIKRRIRAKGRGWVFTPKDFLDIAYRSTIDKVLARLVSIKLIRKLDRGIYDFPVKHDMLGTLSPKMHNLARVIAAKTGDDIICPSGATAANMLGLSLQVPAKSVYLTNGASRTKSINGQIVIIKHARVQLFKKVPKPVNHMLQALAYLGKANITDEIINQCSKILKENDKMVLVKIAPQIPGWISDVVHRIKDLKNI